MTDNELRIKIAEAKGLNVVGMAHCWAPDGPPWSVLGEGTDNAGHDYSPVCLVPDDDRTGDTLLGFACGYPVADLRRVEDYPGDAREWAGLLEEMRKSCLCVAPARDRWVVDLWPARKFSAATLGRAVCEAWLAWSEAKGSEVGDG